MTSFTNILLCLGYLSLFAHGFKVSFYKNKNCAGAYMGTWIGGEDQGCRQDYVGLAEGAVVQSTGPVDDSTTVQFYSSNDCTPGSEISRANFGCVAVDENAVGSYQSFNVVPSNPFNTRSTRRSSDQRRYPFRQPYANATRIVTPKMWHGMDISYDGEQYRLLQVHDNGYVGIPQHKWDDNIHIAVRDKLVPVVGQSLTGRAVGERDLFRDLCDVSTRCIHGVRVGAPQIRDVLQPYMRIAGDTARASGRTVVDFFKSPFFTQLAVETIGGIIPSAVGGVIQAVVGAKITGDTNNIQSCSTQQDQIDALIAIVASQVSAMSAASASISTLQRDAGDEVVTVTMTVTACGTAIEGGGCGVAGGFCPE